MSTQLLIGIAINTLAFGVMGFRNQKLGIKVPNFLLSEFFNIPLTIIYYGSFIIILLSPEKLLLKIIVALLLQFLINHVIWGTITGTIAGRKHLYLSNDIDARKVGANAFVLKNFSFQAAESMSKFDEEQEELLKFATKSIKEIDPLGGIPLGFSWEFVATYPDVVLWWNKLTDEEQDKILVNIDENNFLDKDEKINEKYLRIIIDAYKKNGIELECFY